MPANLDWHVKEGRNTEVMEIDCTQSFICAFSFPYLLIVRMDLSVCAVPLARGKKRK